MADFTLETSLGGRVAGIDEVGRGPLAGPVVAAAVVLTPASAARLSALGLTDSKKLSRRRREDLFVVITEHCEVAVGDASVAEIDAINILHASLLAMRRAYAGLSCRPTSALVDGNRDPNLGCATQTVVKGDSRSLSIAAASVVAKVTRDRLMSRLNELHPGYGWDRNAGYGTAEHLAALGSIGVTPYHRRSFAPVARLCNDSN
ncbi:MAG: ribonuclease HII [Pseudomonadota bacterium]